MRILNDHVGYLRDVFKSDMSEIAEIMVDRLPMGMHYDTLVGTGLSGALAVPRLANHLGLYWAIVRKGEACHSNNMIEGTIGQSWLFVDDLVSTGKTLQRVEELICRKCAAWGHESIYAGTFQYFHGKYSDRAL